MNFLYYCPWFNGLINVGGTFLKNFGLDFEKQRRKAHSVNVRILTTLYGIHYISCRHRKMSIMGVIQWIRTGYSVEISAGTCN